MGIKNYLKNLINNELVKSSVILLILITIGNFINYLFQFIMARMLGPGDYGTLAFLTMFIYIFGIPTNAIQTIVSRYTTKFIITKKNYKIKSLFYGLLKKLSITASFIFVFFVVFSIFVYEFLNIPFWLIFATDIFLFCAFLYPIGLGILQGMKKFNAWGFNFIINSSLKLILSSLLVLFGFRVYGAIIGTVLSTFIAFLVIIPVIKEVLTSKKRSKIDVNILKKENIIVLLSMSILVLMYSFDTLLAKVFFSPENAGIYSASSTIAKIILFGSLTVGGAMFPISYEKFSRENKEKTRGVITKTYFVVLLLCLSAIILFALFPELIISILFGTQYLSASGILLYLGVAFSFISITNILVIYKISVNEIKMKHINILALFLIIELVLLFSFHSTLKEFALAMMFFSIINFIGCFIFIRKWKK